MSLNADAEGDSDGNEPVKHHHDKLAVFGGAGTTSSSQEFTSRSNELGQTAMFGESKETTDRATTGDESRNLYSPPSYSHGQSIMR